MWRRCTGEKGDEGGAVAILVALCLVAVMAMVVLTVDVGALLLRRRAMVNGADAAALAAAKSCFGVEDSDVPGDLADQYAVENSTGLTNDDGGIVQGETHNCDNGKSGHVTVEYHQSESLYFAPVLGLNDSGNVTTKATASWGATGAASPIPLVIYTGFFQGHNCDVPDVEPGTVCTIWEDNNLSGEGNFGFLDVEDGWNVAIDASCPSAGGDGQLEDWIDSSDPVATLHLNYPSATWACTRSGNHSEPQVWDAIRDLIDEVRAFPIVGASPADGQPQQIGTPKPKYNVIGFAQMTIKDVLTVQNTAPSTCTISIGFTNPMDLMTYCSLPSNATFLNNVRVNPGNVNWTVTPDGVFSWTGNRAPTRIQFDYSIPTTSCGGVPAPNSSAHCLVLEWNGSTLGGEEPGGGGNFGYGGIRLCELSYASCIDQSAPDRDAQNRLTLEHQVLSPIPPIPLCKHG